MRIDSSHDGGVLFIDRDGHAKIRGWTVSQSHYINEEDGQAYLLFLDIFPLNAGNVFLYMKNNSDDDMIVSGMRLWADANEAIELYLGKTGTPSGTTELTPSNLNDGSRNAADGDFYEGASISGLSGGTLIDRLRIPGDNMNHIYRPTSDIIIPKLGVLTLNTLNGGVNLEVGVEFYFG